MNEVNSDGISRNLTHLPMLYFSTQLYQKTIKNTYWNNSTSSSTSRFSVSKRAYDPY